MSTPARSEVDGGVVGTATLTILANVAYRDCAPAAGIAAGGGAQLPPRPGVRAGRRPPPPAGAPAPRRSQGPVVAARRPAPATAAEI